jgi:flagellar secretion chaperone FliS
MMYNKQSNAYREVAVQTSSPTKLVVMLYEGAVRFLGESVTAIKSKDLNRKRHAIDRAVAIVQHLHSTLDMDRGGQLAADLNKLYGYITSRIVEGSAKLETAPLEEAIKLLRVLLTSWEELARKEHTEAAPTTVYAQQAAEGGFKLHA